MNNSLTKIGFAFLFSLSTPLVDDVVATNQTLTLDGTKKAGEAAAAYAKQNGAGSAIAVADEGMAECLKHVSPNLSF